MHASVYEDTSHGDQQHPFALCPLSGDMYELGVSALAALVQAMAWACDHVHRMRFCPAAWVSCNISWSQHGTMHRVSLQASYVQPSNCVSQYSVYLLGRNTAAVWLPVHINRMVFPSYRNKVHYVNGLTSSFTAVCNSN